MKPLPATAAVATIAVFWLGLVFGVSFLATLAKFNAPSLALPVALDVGRHTFAWLARTEWVVAAGLAIALVLSGLYSFRTAALVILVAILLLQALWLLPALSARVDIVQAGATLPPSPLHFISVACETGKLLLLLFVAGAALRDLIRSSS